MFFSENTIGPNSQSLIKLAILTLTNSFTAEINSLLIQRFPGELKTYFSAGELLKNEENMEYPVELLHLIENGSIPPRELKLNVCWPIMLLRNLDAMNGLCNGTRMIVKSLKQLLGLAHL